MNDDPKIYRQYCDDNGMQEVHPGEYSSTFRMSPAVNGPELQSVFDGYRMDSDFGLRCTVYGVRRFMRPSSLRFFSLPARYWPWNRLMFQWKTRKGHIEPFVPTNADELWDPIHARELEASGLFRTKIILGNAYEHGRIVPQSARHVRYVSGVTFPVDVFLDTVIAEGDEEAVPGVFLVHEQTTDVCFPVTDASVIHTHMNVGPSYCEMRLDVRGSGAASETAGEPRSTPMV